MQGIVLLLFYFIVFVLPFVGLVQGIIGIKNKIAGKKGVAVNEDKTNRYCRHGIAAVLFILFIALFPISTLSSAKYAKQDALLQFFEANYGHFEEISFEDNHNLFFGTDVTACILGKQRTHGERYDSRMIFELRYRTGTLFHSEYDTNFKNVIVYTETDFAAHNPNPYLFTEIKPTSRANWYFVHVSDDYEYF